MFESCYLKSRVLYICFWFFFLSTTQSKIKPKNVVVLRVCMQSSIPQSEREKKTCVTSQPPPRPKSKLSESNHTLKVAKSEQMPKDEPETNQHVVIIPHDLNPPVKTQCSVTPPAMRKPSPKIKPTNVECDHRLHILQHGSEFLKEDSWSLGTCVGGLGPGTWRGSR